jgi:hypothetical protein
VCGAPAKAEGFEKQTTRRAGTGAGMKIPGAGERHFMGKKPLELNGGPLQGSHDSRRGGVWKQIPIHEVKRL